MRRIAVVGGGISGMMAAYALSPDHEVVLIERDARLGGHTHTVRVDAPEGPLAIDTGFIVFNDRNYPRLVALFQALGIASQPTDMSFSVSCGRTGFEYSSRGASGFFADRANVLRPAHYKLLVEIRRFHRAARRLLHGPDADDLLLERWLERERFSEAFASHFLRPMVSAVWSTSLSDIGSFPARMLATFFDNHGMLQMTGNPRWRVVRGGSARYIDPLTAPYRDRVLLGATITGIARSERQVTVGLRGRPPLVFDEVVIACHGDQVLPLLEDPSDAEREVFSAFRTTRNETWLHTDEGVLPRRRAAQAAWNYHLDREGRGASLTYDMNRLQGLDTAARYCVTLDPVGRVDESKVIRRMAYEHPRYTPATLRAQRRWAEVSGRRRTHYCGAYWFNGFHEDGVRSALRVAESLRGRA
jgi:predicted NAD/FAD-binding protein